VCVCVCVCVYIHVHIYTYIYVPATFGTRATQSRVDRERGLDVDEADAYMDMLEEDCICSVRACFVRASSRRYFQPSSSTICLCRSSCSSNVSLPYIYIYTHTHTRTHPHSHTQTNTHTHTHTHTHTYTTLTPTHPHTASRRCCRHSWSRTSESRSASCNPSATAPPAPPPPPLLLLSVAKIVGGTETCGGSAMDLESKEEGGRGADAEPVERGDDLKG